CCYCALLRRVLPKTYIRSYLLILLRSTTTLFPYTTLFRSAGLPLRHGSIGCSTSASISPSISLNDASTASSTPRTSTPFTIDQRSEEHTSELQSRENLVCRLLLEKKKRKIKKDRATKL